ncbi:hypothetical protein O6H91_08G023300 [Diphasiastrum complanatum]|uniref:Uncharacterized protein n=1 Tax=Diphasiastrum complanatum TaxID=34168 RepID=A0ACC2CVM1_DIPCM|nr:hypothetical protein O6H91_08G023300 [Diphasiastrum complanatum]
MFLCPFTTYSLPREFLEVLGSLWFCLLASRPCGKVFSIHWKLLRRNPNSLRFPCSLFCPCHMLMSSHKQLKNMLNRSTTETKSTKLLYPPLVKVKNEWYNSFIYLFAHAYQSSTRTFWACVAHYKVFGQYCICAYSDVERLRTASSAHKFDIGFLELLLFFMEYSFQMNIPFFA